MGASTVGDDLRCLIAADTDVVQARQTGRELAAELGFSIGDQTVVAAAISEIARNILMYAKRGEVRFTKLIDGTRTGLIVVAEDDGPGIRDVSRAMQDGYSTSRGMGMGLPGVRRLMDEFSIRSKEGVGATITCRKWRW